MQEVINIRLQDIFYFHDIVEYVVTKFAKQPLTRSQSCWTICEGRAVLDNNHSYMSYSVIDPGIHKLRVYGRTYMINLLPIALEVS
jgi:hypothetical protein